MMGDYIWFLIREDTSGHKRKARSTVHFSSFFEQRVLCLSRLVINIVLFDRDSHVQINLTTFA